MVTAPFAEFIRRKLLLTLCALPFAFLWFILIDQLRVEWSVNPQYSYGWFVPVLCGYLVWRRVGAGSQERRAKGREREAGRQEQGVGSGGEAGRRYTCAEQMTRRWIFCLGFIICAGLLAPTRLIQEANPEWRLVSWALAFEVITLSLLYLHHFTPPAPPPHRLPSSALRPPVFPAALTFPILFFLVAVPWPTIVEGPVIQGLTRFNASAVVYCLSWFGIPALQHGNLIEVSTGPVGIDEACSGIRSFQASLMIALFLGERYRLTANRRSVLCLTGFALAIVCNLIRTALLVWVAARHGTPAISSWHDPAGITILFACFLGLWAVALWAKSREQAAGTEDQSVGPSVRRSVGHTASPTHRPTAPLTHRLPPSVLRPLTLTLPLALGLWLILIEAGVELWYRSHESGLRQAVDWCPDFPRANASFHELPLGEKAKQLLRYDEGMNGVWRDGSARWQMIFLRWDPGRIAVHLATSHTPQSCLAAAGERLLSASDLKYFSVGGLKLPFRGYEVDAGGDPLHVFYCLWEGRATEHTFAAASLTHWNRLVPVLAGRRNLGQCSLEIAVSGFEDLGAAEAAVIRQLQTLIRVGR